MQSRAIAARLQAEYIPPLRLLPFGRTRAPQFACCPRARGKWPGGPKGVHGRMACEGNQFAENIKHRTPRTGKGDREAVEEVHGLTDTNNARLQLFTSVVAPRTGARSAGCRWHPRVWPAGAEEVHGYMNSTFLSSRFMPFDPVEKIALCFIPRSNSQNDGP